jgi:uncharacterized membrane protein YjgN (DUF898 family)
MRVRMRDLEDPVVRCALCVLRLAFCVPWNAARITHYAARSTHNGFRFGQATKGAWWMPWGKEPMKGAVTSEMRRGSGNKN